MLKKIAKWFLYGLGALILIGIIFGDDENSNSEEKLKTELVKVDDSKEKAEAERIAKEKAEAERMAKEEEAKNKAEAERLAKEADKKSILKKKINQMIYSDSTNLDTGNMNLNRRLIMNGVDNENIWNVRNAAWAPYDGDERYVTLLVGAENAQTKYLIMKNVKVTLGKGILLPKGKKVDEFGFGLGFTVATNNDIYKTSLEFSDEYVQLTNVESSEGKWKNFPITIEFTSKEKAQNFVKDLNTLISLVNEYNIEVKK